MRTATLAGAAFAIALLVLGLAAGYRALVREFGPGVATSSSAAQTAGAAAATEADEEALAKANPGFLYGRVTTDDGVAYEGRLRWGGREEAFWGDYFNGTKSDNPWAAQVPPERLPKTHRPLKILGFEILDRQRPIDLHRPFMERFGDIVRIEANGFFEVRVTLKSGTVFDLARLEAGDFDDGVRIWSARGDVVDLGPRQIHSIEFLPTARLRAAPQRLHGTVRTPRGDFTGFLQWDRQDGVVSDTLDGQSADGEISLRFDTLRSIARREPDGALATLLDGAEIVLTGSREVGQDNRGIYVDDRRYGRVLVSWGAFERVDFSPGGSGPAYGDFPAGQPLKGSVATRDGRRFAGRLVYDLDESETTDTLDAPSQGVDYTLPFGFVASIRLPAREQKVPRGRVTLHSGEELDLELQGDLGQGNAGLLVFVEGRPNPEYVPWSEVQEVDFDRPPAMYPPLGED